MGTNKTWGEDHTITMSDNPEQGNKRRAQAQAQVGEVVDIMRMGVEKVLERDSKLSELDQRADNLQEGANQFQTQATKLKRKYWWQNMKMIIGVIVAILLIIIIVWASSGGSDDSAPAVTT